MARIGAAVLFPLRGPRWGDIAVFLIASLHILRALTLYIAKEN